MDIAWKGMNAARRLSAVGQGWMTHLQSYILRPNSESEVLSLPDSAATYIQTCVFISVKRRRCSLLSCPASIVQAVRSCTERRRTSMQVQAAESTQQFHTHHTINHDASLYGQREMS